MPRLLLLSVLAIASVTGVVPQLGDTTSQRVSLCELSICECPPAKSSLKCVCNEAYQDIILRGKKHGTSYSYLLPKTLGSITIEKCNKVIVESNSIADIVPLRKVTLTNITQLEIGVEAFSWKIAKIPYLDTSIPAPGIDILIKNSNIQRLESDSFKGHINSIILEHVHIETIKTLAFANLERTDNIEFTHCRIKNIERHAFNRFIVSTITIEGGYIRTLPSNSMNSIKINKYLKFVNIKIDQINSRALVIQTDSDPFKFSLSSCIIENLSGEAFIISMKDTVVISDNIIKKIDKGAFVGIHLDERLLSHKIQEELVFENNTITTFSDYALTFNTSGIKPIIDRIVLDTQCSCNDIKTWSTKLVKYTSTRTPDSFAEKIWCKKGKASTVVSEYSMKHCAAGGSKVYWIVTILIIVLISLLCICSLGFWLYRTHARRYINVPTRDNNRISVLSANNHIIVLPEKKIYEYKQTELYVTAESVEPIKEYVSPQEVNQPT